MLWSRNCFLGFLAVASLYGCGFHLQGRELLPADMLRIHVVAEDQQSDFIEALRSGLRTSGAELTRDEKSATAVIRVKRDELTQKVLAVSSRNLPREYELTYRVQVSVNAGAQLLMDNQELELTRNFTFDEREVLAKEHERDQLRGELARELAASLLRRLRSR